MKVTITPGSLNLGQILQMRKNKNKQEQAATTPSETEEKSPVQRRLSERLGGIVNMKFKMLKKTLPDKKL